MRKKPTKRMLSGTWVMVKLILPADRALPWFFASGLSNHEGHPEWLTGTVCEVGLGSGGSASSFPGDLGYGQVCPAVGARWTEKRSSSMKSEDTAWKSAWMYGNLTILIDFRLSTLQKHEAPIRHLYARDTSTCLWKEKALISKTKSASLIS